MIFKINVFQWLCRTEHLTVFHMECACTHHCSSIMCVSWAQARGFLREDKPRLVASHLASPHLATSRVTVWPEGFLSRKKDEEKGRRYIQKYFIAASVSVREGKNSDVRLTFSALQVRRWSSESLHRSVQLTFSQSHEARRRIYLHETVF